MLKQYLLPAFSDAFEYILTDWPVLLAVDDLTFLHTCGDAAPERVMPNAMQVRRSWAPWYAIEKAFLGHVCLVLRFVISVVCEYGLLGTLLSPSMVKVVTFAILYGDQLPIILTFKCYITVFLQYQPSLPVRFPEHGSRGLHTIPQTNFLP